MLIEVNSKIIDIIKVLNREADEIKNISLFEGLSGIALFFCMYGKCLNDEYYINRGRELLLNKIFDEISERANIHYSFCNGLSGVGWIYEYLYKENLVNIDPNDVLKELDDYLLRCFLILKKTPNWDFLHGSMGLAWYFIKRSQSNPLFIYMIIL